MDYIKHKITGALIVALLFSSACNGGDGSGYWKSYRVYRYIHSQGEEEIRKAGHLVSLYRYTFVTKKAMQLGTLIAWTYYIN